MSPWILEAEALCEARAVNPRKSQALQHNSACRKPTRMFLQEEEALSLASLDFESSEVRAFSEWQVGASILGSLLSVCFGKLGGRDPALEVVKQRSDNLLLSIEEELRQPRKAEKVAEPPQPTEPAVQVLPWAERIAQVQNEDSMCVTATRRQV